MILKASQRGGGKALALHLLKTHENEHVEVHEVRGFVSDDVTGAFKEAHAISKGTRCRQYLFSVSLNPPETANVPVEAFENALDRIEERMGLSGQPRVVVFHEKEGRRHCHAVWSRIDPEQMKAVQLSHFKFKLRGLSRELFIEHGWRMPRGLMDSRARDPRNFTLAEWQQAKRQGADPREIKQVLQECWAASDGGRAFSQVLRERGMRLAKGDRRSFVAVDFRGEIFSLPRYLGRTTKQVRERLGDMELPSVEAAKKEFAEQITPMLRRHLDEIGRTRKRGATAGAHARAEIVQRHRFERQQQDEAHKKRRETEALQRAARLPRGLRGLWGWLTGKSQKLRAENEADFQRCEERDRQERESLRARQLVERQTLQARITALKQRSRAEVLELRRDIGSYARGQSPERIAAVRRSGPELN